MTDPLRIAVVAACPFPAPRGTPVRIQRLAEEVARRGHEVHVLTYHVGESGAAAPYHLHRIRDVPSCRPSAPGPTPGKLLLLDPLLARMLRRFLASRPVDLIHAHHYEGLLAAWWARRREPVIYDAHTTLASELPAYRLWMPRPLKRGLGRLLDRALPRRAAHTVAVTEAVRDALVAARAVAPDRVTVVTNGVEAETFRVAPGEAPVDAAGAPAVVFAGNLAPYQGIDLLLRAFAGVRRKCAGARLLVVTDSAFEPYEPLARELRLADSVTVRRAGSLGELAVLLASARVAVNPRVACAGVPLKLLNYMAAGKAIVSFAGSAVHLRDGETGLVVRDGDTEAMAAAILRLLDDEALGRRLGEAARRKAVDELSWGAAAQKLEAVYRRVVRGG